VTTKSSNEVPPLSERGTFDETMFFRPGEIAVVLQMSPKSVWRQGFPCVRTPGSVRRYRRDLLAQWVPQQGDPQLLRPEQAAVVLGIARCTAVMWMRDGRIPGAVKLPQGRHRVARAVLDEMTAGWGPR
jgi:hypothetical protein